ncbi:MAG: S8 family serine peptidase [Actinobacteria bacterium]|nr:S8 family serine peptidase [Actinomycetota bacterium]
MLRRTLVVFGALSLLLATLAPGALAEDRPDADLTEAAGTVRWVSGFEAPNFAKSGRNLVPIIVKLDEQAVASYDGSVAGLAATSPVLLGLDKLDADSEAVVSYRAHLANRHALFAASARRVAPQATVTHSYDIAFGGVAMIVPADAITAIAKLPGVVAVYADVRQQLDTDRSAQFIGTGSLWKELGGRKSAGQGIIVGVVDTGIWPEHPSFSDPDPRGKAYAPPVWSGSGTGDGCDFGDTAYNPNDAPFTCNNKLIGAYDFTDTYKLLEGLLPTEFDSARDSNGHGTHTTSTAAGNGAVTATLLGVNRGKITGIAPRAHVVMYKGCGELGCYDSDTMASIQQAILDGVDVISYSIGGGDSPYGDGVSLSFLDAYNAGILGTPSAGNDGPGADTVGHREPWTLTVGASTTDRSFIGSLMLRANNGDTLEVEGASVTGGIGTWTPVVMASDPECHDTMAPGTYSGQIVLCDRGDIDRVLKSYNVMEAGGGGMVLMNLALQGLSTDNHYIPSIHVEVTETNAIKAFMGSHTLVKGQLVGGTATTVQGDLMADFSSRGGPGQTLGISKPDVVAPGVQILAGNTPMPETPSGGQPGELFQAIQGTSMAAPHAAGTAALLLAAHPDWTPGEVKSAMMMSALRNGVVQADGTRPARPFDRGSGRIRPSAAATVPLTISDTGASYLAHEDDLWNSNYPSLYVPSLAGSITVERTVFNQRDTDLDVTVTASGPNNLVVTVQPSTFTLGPNGSPSATRTIEITVDASMVPVGSVRHAALSFEADEQRLFFPITIVKGVPDVTLDKTCAPASVPLGGKAMCDIVVENYLLDPVEVTITDLLPRGMILKGNQPVVGAVKVTQKKLTTTVLLDAAVPPPILVAVNNFASPTGYLDLSGFGPTTVSLTDEAIANFSVPSFEYAGVSYDAIGIVSNGYLVLGGGTAADVTFINSDLPDAALPNNVLAPFWTDLNPSAGGDVYIGVLTDGFDTWIVVEWQAVPNWGDGEPNTFQVWIGLDSDSNPSQDISFTYGAVSDGDGGFLTVGAENYSGTTGGVTYLDGAGAPPAPSFGGGSAACDGAWPAPPCYEVAVTAGVGAAGGTHTISFMVRGTRVGTWTNWVTMTGGDLVGIVTDGFDFEVTP